MHYSAFTKMHDNDRMAAIQGAQISPIHAQDMHHTIIKRPFEPLAKPTDEFNDNFDEEIDDDDFSDHDSHYSEDLVDTNLDSIDEQAPDITQRLLNFAEMVNADIQKFFGKKKDEESCDIYEDKWVTTKSGRELYYADLLRIAQGENVDSKHTKDLISLTNSPELVDNKQRYSGKLDEKLGLGPLGELFEYGLREFIVDKKTKTKKLKRLKFDSKKLLDILPMHQRKLPDSFWREPGAGKSADQKINGTGVILNSSQPPDFSDLLHSWTRGEDDEYSGDMSSSELSVASPESAMDQM